MKKKLIKSISTLNITKSKISPDKIANLLEARFATLLNSSTPTVESEKLKNHIENKYNWENVYKTLDFVMMTQ